MQTQTLRIITATLVIVFIMLYMHTNSEQRFYSKTAEPAVAQILAEISTWQEEPLLRHLAPEARETITDEQLKQLLDRYREFGWFYSVNELNFSRTASFFSLFGDKRINYSGVADYSTGPVSLNMTLVERGGYFLVYNFSLARATD
ncbi:MAG: hypothetical protein MRJ52_03570 [Nitrosomonas sp.]|jgi:hypothetical protein|nr:hypothetical protein [Burkholderiales bacterium]MDR4651462.1 hypothetical protein [Nitrosomonas sp.]